MSDNLMINVESMVSLAESNQATAAEMASMVRQMSDMVQQMGVAIMTLDARMRAQEELLSKRVTVTSKQVNGLMAAIRARAAEVQGMYDLPADSRALIRKAIKADALRAGGVNNLHDLPESRLRACTEMVQTWESYRLVREIRTKLGI